MKSYGQDCPLAHPRAGRCWLACSRMGVARLPHERAVATRALRVRSLPELGRAFPSWLKWSPSSPAVRAASAGAEAGA